MSRRRQPSDATQAQKIAYAIHLLNMHYRDVSDARWLLEQILGDVAKKDDGTLSAARREEARKVKGLLTELLSHLRPLSIEEASVMTRRKPKAGEASAVAPVGVGGAPAGGEAPRPPESGKHALFGDGGAEED